jgi:hypothetical protein
MVVSALPTSTIGVAIFFAGELALSRVLRLHFRNRPY